MKMVHRRSKSMFSIRNLVDWIKRRIYDSKPDSTVRPEPVPTLKGKYAKEFMKQMERPPSVETKLVRVLKYTIICADCGARYKRIDELLVFIPCINGRVIYIRVKGHLKCPKCRGNKFILGEPDNMPW